MTNSLVLGLLARQTYTPAWWLLVSLITRFVARTTTSVEIDFPSAQREAKQRTTGQSKIRQTALRKNGIEKSLCHFSGFQLPEKQRGGEERHSEQVWMWSEILPAHQQKPLWLLCRVHWGFEHSLVVLELSQNIKFTSVCLPLGTVSWGYNIKNLVLWAQTNMMSIITF